MAASIGCIGEIEGLDGLMKWLVFAAAGGETVQRNGGNFGGARSTGSLGTHMPEEGSEISWSGRRSRSGGEGYGQYMYCPQNHTNRLRLGAITEEIMDEIGGYLGVMVPNRPNAVCWYHFP